MAEAAIRLLIVDDSAVMRRFMRETFGPGTGFVVETAATGEQALAVAARFRPDVITLDVQMPGMDGLACLRALPSRHPCPVVMVSSLTAEGARVTLEALSLGAVDFIAKPTAAQAGDLARIRTELVTKVRTAATTRQAARPATAAPAMRPAPPPVPPRVPRIAGPGLVLIGVSTGGPRALERIVPLLPRDLPWPVLVAQHMPATFTGVLAQRLDSRSALGVVEVTAPMPLRPGVVHIAAGETDLVVARDAAGLVARPVPPDTTPWHPSADRLVRTAMEAVPAQGLIGVLLTGMGNDGAEAMAELHRRGGRTIAESEASCVVFGMPADLIRRGGATAVLPAERVAATLVEWLHAGPVRRAG